MIRVRLLNEGRTVKQISSRVGESSLLERIQRFDQPYDEVVVLEGELSEGAKEILQKVAKRVIPAAMAAGIALGGAGNAQAQNAFPGTDRSIGQHISDILSPNYREIVRQRRAEQDAERRAWDARQREIAKAKIARAREEGRREAQGIAGTDMPGNVKVYDQARKSQDGKSYVLYDMQHNVIRIPVNGTEFVPADSQRLAHYLTARGGVYYVRQAAAEHQNEGITEDPTVGTIPATGGTSASTIKSTGTRAPGGGSATADKTGEDTNDEQALELDKDHGLDKDTMAAIKKAGVAVNIKEGEDMSRLEWMLRGSQEVLEAVGDRYDEKLADRLYRENPRLSTKGRAEEFVSLAFDLVKQDLGQQRARYLFGYDQDFVSDLIDAYAELQKSAGVGESSKPVLKKDYSPEEWSDLVKNVGKKAKEGPREIVWNPKTRAYTTAPVKSKPVKEGFTDAKLQAILDQYHDSWQAFKAGGDIDDNTEFYDALFDYFMDSGEMPYEVAKARGEDPIEWMTNKMDTLAGNEKVSESDDDLEATAADQAAADKNIIMQLRKAADYDRPTSLTLDDGSRVEVDAAMSQKILRMFDQLRPDSKSLMQQILGTRKGFDELTKELSKARESVREAAEQYTSLNDAYPAGSTEIWYWLDDNARDFMMGYDFLKKQGVEVTPETIPTTHALIGRIRETDPEKIFAMMQGESWSPEGQARDMIKKSGTGHTSMSVGDVIRIGDKWMMVDRYGFKDIGGANESIDFAETHMDPRKTAMLIADRIMGEVFDK